MDTQMQLRPRRSRHDSSKLYDRERKDLELTEVLDVLQRYVDYGGGINCCVCGKLYMRRVCFIKHLWEHTIYWDLFAGDKNHMRVLSIQAALILYATGQQSLGGIPVDNLLVTSPHSTDLDARLPVHSTDLASSSPTFSSEELQKVPCPVSGIPAFYACNATKLYQTIPFKQCIILPKIPGTPRKKFRKVSLKIRDPPPKLDLKIPEENPPQSPQHSDTTPDFLPNSQNSMFSTPVKQGIHSVVPTAPKKSKKFSKSHTLQNPQVRRCLFPTTEVEDLEHWKDGDFSACKRKRSE